MNLVILVALLISALICHFIAKAKGASPAFWGLMGAIFGPFAIPFCLMASPKVEEEDDEED